MAIIDYALCMHMLSFKAAQQRRQKAQSMVDECCSMSRSLASSYLNNPPQQYFLQRCNLAKAISDHLQFMAQSLCFDITPEECRSFGAIIAAWPNTSLFHKALLTFRFEVNHSRIQPSLFLAAIEEYVQELQITRKELDGLLTACLIAFTCVVGDVYIESLQVAE
ncbi:MAG: hypothetical protein HRU20_02115 [Pseudomonadales bacterium]|nr:hypothetical protein [Pseudomonadales bacterium]